jgi:hypothetical protein
MVEGHSYLTTERTEVTKNYSFYVIPKGSMLLSL